MCSLKKSSVLNMSYKFKNVFCVFFFGLLSLSLLAEDVNSLTGPAHDKVVVCYVGTWAAYRLEKGKFTIDSIDPQLCTHLVYSFAGLNSTSWTIRSLDPWQDLRDNYGLGSYEKATGLKQRYPHLKVTLAIGGWNEGSKNYSDMAADPVKRKMFIASAVEFLKKYNFDGLDLDWEYPAARGGMPYDKENYVKLAMELKSEFRQHNFLLTAALGANRDTAAIAYDYASLTKYLDFLHLMCYDYHGTWDSRAGPNAPLFGTDPADVLSVEATVNYVLEQGADPWKVVVGIPLYGRTFIKVSPNDVEDLGSMTQSAGFQGQYTKETGFMGYNEICTELSNSSGGWHQHWDSKSKTPYAVNEDKIIVYDNERSLVEKVRFAMGKGLRGVMVWSIDTDDFRGDCPPEEGAYQDFYTGINELRSSPFYKDTVPQLPLPNDKNGGSQNSTLDIGRRSSDGMYKIENGELTLVLPHRSKPNFPLMRTLNEALVLSKQEIMIKKMLEKKIKEKESENEIIDNRKKFKNSAGRQFDFTVTLSIVGLMILGAVTL